MEKNPMVSVGTYFTLCFTGLAYKTKMFIPYLCEQPTVAAPMSVTGFHYGNSAKKGHRHKNPLKCFLLLYIFFCDKNSPIFEFKKL